MPTAAAPPERYESLVAGIKTVESITMTFGFPWLHHAAQNFSAVLKTPACDPSYQMSAMMLLEEELLLIGQHWSREPSVPRAPLHARLRMRVPRCAAQRTHPRGGATHVITSVHRQILREAAQGTLP